ncbi:MAG: hypothetical protein QN131_15385 [Armatimonadota bacterium]|nr:hypothetical protein [Armatimonadota bacterium]
MRVFELEPGAATPLHEHRYKQEMSMLEGRGAPVGDHGQTPLEPGPVTWVAPLRAASDLQHGRRR